MAKANNYKLIETSKAKRGLIIALIIGLLTAFFIVILTFKAQTLDFISQASFPLLLLSLFILLLSYSFNALTLTIFCRAIGRKIPFYKNLIIFLAGTFASYVTPFGSGGLPAQVFFLSNIGLDAGEALAVVSSRALISIWFFGLISPLFAILLGEGITLPYLIPLISIIFVTFIFFLFLYKPALFEYFLNIFSRNGLLKKSFGERRLTSAYEKIANVFYNFRSHISVILKKPVYLVLALSAETAAWITFILVAVAIIASLGWLKNLTAIYFRIVLLLAVIPFSPTPGGSGIAEGGMAALLKNLAPLSLAGPVVLIWRFITYYLILIIGGLAFSSFLKIIDMNKL